MSRGVRQACAAVAVLLAAFASLATSTDCVASLELSDGASLTQGSSIASVRYRVVAPRGTALGARVVVSTSAGATVNVTWVPDDPSLWSSEGGVGLEAPVAGVSAAAGSSERVSIALPRCVATGCSDYAATLTVELVAGSDAEVEWAAEVELDECAAGVDFGDYYFEISRE